MTPGEIAAYVGAAAWLPQIARWIITSRSKPRLRISTSPTVDIGYNALGPVVNVTCALSSETRDALIEKITLRVVHERGDSREFVWKWMNEAQGQIRLNSAEGEMVEFSKNQPAIAIKVSTSSLAEKKITFALQDWRGDSVISSAVEAMDGELEINDVILQHTMFYTEACRFFSDSMYWREGAYKFELTVNELRLGRHTERFRVGLSRADIDTLRRNLNVLTSTAYYMNTLKTKRGEKVPQTVWNWVFPQIYRE